MERTERYNYVFDQYDGDSFIYDLKEDKRIEDLSECANILNKKEKEIERWIDHKNFDTQVYRGLIDEIEELKSRLSICIEPKFKVGQEVYMLDSTKVKITGYKIINFDNLETLYRVKDGELTFGNIPENELFATEAEAKKHLEELKNG